MVVSFCVIAFNEAEVLHALFADIRAQDYPHDKMEVVLVNAMSTDNTRMIMEKFACEENGFRRVVVIDNPKKNQASGWNVAIQEAQGDAILRIDAHASVPKDFVSKNVACLETGEYVSGGQRPNIVDRSTPWKETLLLAETSMFGSGIAPYRKGTNKRYVDSVFHGAYRREVFENAGLFNEHLGRTEDNEMHYRIRKAGYKICFNQDIISYQHVRGTWKSMIKQKYGNGRWIGLTLSVCPQCFAIYHFVPMCFVLAIFGTLVLSVIGRGILFSLLAFTYAFAAILMALLAVRGKEKHWQYVLLPLIFFSLHFAYGFGTLVGIFQIPFWCKDGVKSVEGNTV